MTQNAPQHDVATPSPIGPLVRAVAMWGGGAALIAVSVAVSRGVADAAVLGVVSVLAASLAGFGLLYALPPRGAGAWALPMLAAQMLRTMLAPAIGIGVMLLSTVDSTAFWLTLLAVAGAMLAGETITMVGLLGRTSQHQDGGHAADKPSLNGGEVAA